MSDINEGLFTSDFDSGGIPSDWKPERMTISEQVSSIEKRNKQLSDYASRLEQRISQYEGYVIPIEVHNRELEKLHKKIYDLENDLSKARSFRELMNGG